jgi:hypothetical protein
MSGSSLHSASYRRVLRFIGLLTALVSGTCVSALSPSFAVVAPANLPAAWLNWLYSREVKPTNASALGLVAILVPEDVYAHSANHLDDVRIVDDQGREVPFVMDVPRGETHTERRSVRTLEHSFVPEQFSQFVLDAGDNAQFHNAILVNTPESDFITWAEVGVSDDARQWRIVCDRAPLFRFSQQNLQGTQTLHYSDSNARYIRLRIFDGAKRFSISSVQVLYEVASREESVAVSVPVASVPSANSHESAWEADLPAELPANAVHFETSEPEFSRSVTIESSEDQKDWTPVGGGEIYRFRRDNVLREWLRVSFSGGWSAHWRVHVINGSNAPLAEAHITIHMTPRRLIFRAAPARRYLLLYGQSEAKKPEYDLARTIYVKDFATVPVATLGPEVVNVAYEDPRPWTERHPGALWIAVILAAGLLGVTALRSLRSSS